MSCFWDINLDGQFTSWLQAKWIVEYCMLSIHTCIRYGEITVCALQTHLCTVLNSWSHALFLLEFAHS